MALRDGVCGCLSFVNRCFWPVRKPLRRREESQVTPDPPARPKREWDSPGQKRARKQRQGWEVLEEDGVQWLHIGNGWLPPMVEVPLHLQIGDREFRRLVKPPTVEALWEWYEEHGKASSDPSWAQVWPCCAALAQHVATHPELVRRRRVFELGAGLGVPSIAAALAGARDVLLLDREPLALHCAASTAAVHNLPVASVNDESAADNAVRAAVYDWAEPQNFNVRAEVVLASEVLYDCREAQDVAVAALRLMCGGQGRVLIADPRKERLPGTRAALAQQFRQAGATVEIYEVPTPNLGEGLADQENVVLIDAYWPR